jgi:hypothetical protein
MKITATDEVREFVRKRGGRLFVWTSTHRCCTGPTTLLDADTESPAGDERSFREFDGGGFRLLLDSGGREPPKELVLELRGIRRKVVAFWDDLAWVV